MNEEIRVLIIDDEEIWRLAVSQTLNQLGYTIAGLADTFENAVTLLNTDNYDIVLLDINLKCRTSGIELGKMLNQLYKKPYIYITGNLDILSTQQVIDSKPSAYLLKPVNTTSLIVAIQNALEHFNNTPSFPITTKTEQDTFFFVKHGTKYKKMDWTNIAFLRSEKNYTILYNTSDNSEHAIRSTLTRTIKQIIPPYLQNQFVQINRSEALQISYIIEIRDEEIKTKHGTFTVTDGYYNTLKQSMQLIA